MKLTYSKPLSGAAILAALALGIATVPSGPLYAAETRAPIEGGDAPTTSNPDVEPTEFPQGVLFPYSLLDYALAGNVDPNGNVSYVNLKGNKYLLRFVRALSTADLKQFPVFDYMATDPKTGRDSIPKKDHTAELVFWINAYNAQILNTVASAYPIKSVDEIKDLDTAKTHIVAGKNYSLKEIKQKVADFNDPRAMFALTTCTAGGVLPMTSAMRTAGFDDELNAAVRTFVNDSRNVSVNRLQNVVTVSSTFQDVCTIYKVDGRLKDDAIRTALAAYTTGNGAGYFGSGSYKIDFKKANRALNDKTNRGMNSE
jgi:hypothetical protein